MNAQHTRTPWRVMSKEGRYIAAANEAGVDVVIADLRNEHGCVTPSTKDNAAFIVRAVNAHDELVAALRDVEGRLSDLARLSLAGQGYWRAVKRARAALVKAGAA